MVLRLSLSIHMKLELQTGVHLLVQVSPILMKEMVRSSDYLRALILISSQERTRVVSRNFQNNFSPLCYTPICLELE